MSEKYFQGSSWRGKGENVFMSSDITGVLVSKELNEFFFVLQGIVTNTYLGIFERMLQTKRNPFSLWGQNNW